MPTATVAHSNPGTCHRSRKAHSLSRRRERSSSMPSKAHTTPDSPTAEGTGKAGWPHCHGHTATMDGQLQATVAAADKCRHLMGQRNTTCQNT